MLVQVEVHELKILGGQKFVNGSAQTCRVPQQLLSRQASSSIEAQRDESPSSDT